MKYLPSRRDFLRLLTAGTVAVPLTAFAAETAPFKFRYVVATNQFGKEKLETILSVVKQLGTETIDLWGEHWANQREQVAEMGEDAFRKLLDRYGVKLGCITAFQGKTFKLADEIRFVKRFGGDTVITGSPGFGKDESPETSIAKWIESRKAELDLAAELGVKIASENHLRQVTETPEGLKLFVDATKQHPSLGIALAPRHLPQDEKILAELIRYCGPKLFFFYAWQSTGGTPEMEKDERERTQLPGRGKLDFKPLVDALKSIHFEGFTEIFMHPSPRGRLIHDTVEKTVEELNASRSYLDSLR